MKKTVDALGPAEIIELVASELRVSPKDLESRRGPWTQAIRRQLKKAGMKDPATGRYTVSLIGAQILFREMRGYFLTSLGRESEAREMEEQEESARTLLRDRRRHFEKHQPPEWVAATREAFADAEARADAEGNVAGEPLDYEPSPELLEYETQREERIRRDHAMSQDEELSFMIRAIFFHSVGKDFDLEQLHEDYVERRYLSGILQYPGDGPLMVQMAGRLNKLSSKVDSALEGRDLQAYRTEQRH